MMKYTRNKEQVSVPDGISKPELQRGSKRANIILGVGMVALATAVAGSYIYKPGNSSAATSESNSVPSVSTEVPHAKKVTKPIPKKPSISPSIAEVRKLEARYPMQQRATTIGKSCLIGLPGHMKRPSSVYSADERLQISLFNLKSAKVSAARYKAFEVADISKKIETTPPYNFNGLLDSVALSAPLEFPRAVKSFVFELTTMSDTEYNWDGATFAANVTKLNKHAGYQYYTNRQLGGLSQTYHLSDTFTSSLISRNLNLTIEAVDTAGCEQASVEPIEYEHNIYTAAQFLISHNYLANGKPVTPITNAFLKGQREFEPYGPDGFSELIMDQVRPREVALLHQLGYSG
jgi:hypothetical protein